MADRDVRNFWIIGEHCRPRDLRGLKRALCVCLPLLLDGCQLLLKRLFNAGVIFQHPPDFIYRVVLLLLL